MLDMWSTYCLPRQTDDGTGAARFAVVPHGWQGKLPEASSGIDAPTPYVWINGRTQNQPCEKDLRVRPSRAGCYTIHSRLSTTGQGYAPAVMPQLIRCGHEDAPMVQVE
jgi:hypothetical protein